MFAAAGAYDGRKISPGDTLGIRRAIVRVDQDADGIRRLSGDLFTGPEPAAAAAVEPAHRWVASFVSVGAARRSPTGAPVTLWPLAIVFAPGDTHVYSGRLLVADEGFAAGQVTIVFERLPRSLNEGSGQRVRFQLEHLHAAFRRIEILVWEIEPPERFSPFGPGAKLPEAERALVALAQRVRGRVDTLLGDGPYGLAKAFARARIEATARRAFRFGEVPKGTQATLASLRDADRRARWTREALNEAMLTLDPAADDPDRHLRDPAQPFRAHLLLAGHFLDPGFGETSNIIIGTMFDDEGDDAGDGARHNGPRQGAAIFLLGVARALAENYPQGPSDQDIDRTLCFFTMHELSHVLNLPHSFAPPRELGRTALPEPAALSWTNYPKLWPEGNATAWGPSDRHAVFSRNYHAFMERFWADPGPRYTSQELLHLQHAAYCDIGEQQDSIFD